MRTDRASRRAIVCGSIATALASRLRPVSAQATSLAFSSPIGLADRIAGDGFFIRHGYACENTWYNPGWWHTGEDWYLVEGETASALIYAVGDGEVVFVGSEYPGRVVIVRHADDLYSMYGHLAYEPAVEEGEPVTRGQTLGSVLLRTDGRAPSHLHFELRTFLTTTEVNGDAPRYGVACGFQCPPGPGYWPIDAPEHPSAMGWRNPTHVIARRTFPDEQPAVGAEVVVTEYPSSGTATIWSAPEGTDGAEPIGELTLRPGDRYPLLAIDSSPEATEETSAEAYRLWYQINSADGEPGWVQAAVPSSGETGSDGRPSTVRLDFLLAVAAMED